MFAVDLDQNTKNSTWSFSGEIRNLLANTTLEAPVPPFGDEGDYSVSSTHVVFTSKDPELNPAWHTKQNVSVMHNTIEKYFTDNVMADLHCGP